MGKVTSAAWVLLLCSLVNSQSTDDPIITTQLGQVQGVTQTSNTGKTYYSFRGIPFAQPPTGNLRLMRPEPAVAWTGVRDASVEGPDCTQNIMNQVDGDEDCLYLNVHTPELPGSSTENKSVMVFIHGGAYMIGSGSETAYGPGKLMGYDVISVMINYRLNVFGFLSTGDAVIPGNYGVWDQVMALQWVQDNIAAFGGDPNRVIIHGQSAGAQSVAALILSPAAKGLFSGAISQSGNSITPWQYEPLPLQYAQQVAEYLDCPSDNTTLMLPCLQNVTQEALLDSFETLFVSATGNPVYLLPVVDSQASEQFFPDLPINLIRDRLYNNVPYISGTNENEGGTFYEGIMQQGIVFDRDFIDNDLDVLVYNYTLLTGENLTEVTALVYDYYFNDIDLDNETAIGLGVQAVMSDMMFNLGSYLTLSLLPKGDDFAPVYSYVLTYFGEYVGDPEDGMTTHGDEIVYIFDIDQDNGGILDAQDNITSERILTFWTTFAKTGNPNPDSSDVISITWEAVPTTESVPVLNIGDDLSMDDTFRGPRMVYWNNTILPVINFF